MKKVAESAIFLYNSSIMDKKRNLNSRTYWNGIHEKNAPKPIVSDGWLDDFSDVIENSVLPVIDLGCGSGNNIKTLTAMGKAVIACDLSETAVALAERNFPGLYAARCFDMTEGLPFADASADLIIADLSLHYFTRPETAFVLGEIRRVLTGGGYLLFRVNSVNDVNHGAGQGEEVETHLYRTEDGRLKRFFTEADIRDLFRDFDIEFLREETMTRYDTEKKLFRCRARGRREV